MANLAQGAIDFGREEVLVVRQHKEEKLAFNSHDISKLHRIIALAEKLILNGSKQGKRVELSGRKAGKRVRRTGKELVQFRKMLKAERKRGVPVAELARRHRVSSAYIYMLP